MADDRFYVKTLTLENFRCFEKAELGPFDPHFNLLVGENGAGKSSVLVALAQLFSFIPTTFGRLSPPPLVRGADMAASQEAFAPIQQSKETIKLSAAYLWLEEEKGVEAIVFEDDTVNIQAVDRKGEGRQLILSVDKSIPLVVRFTASRLFRRTIPATGDPTPSRESKRGNSFLGWSDAGASSDELLRWMRDETLKDFDLVRENRWRVDKDNALGLVRVACSSAIDGAVDLFYNGTKQDIIVTFEDGRKLSFSGMSDGQRALTGLIAELARRIWLLNGGVFGSACLRETPGLVLIDEIDLHLHPKWQRRIVPALKKIFPKIQFFATTHSPQVIGEAQPNEIVLLTPQGQKRPSGSYGRDSNWILECVMDAEGRDPDIALRLKTLFNLIEDEKFNEARTAIKSLRQDIGYGPDIVGAEAYLWRMEHLGDEAAE